MNRIFNQNRTVSINSSSKHFTDSVKTKKENSIQFNNDSTNSTNTKSGTDVALDIALGVAVISATDQVSNLSIITSLDCGQTVDVGPDCGGY